MRNVIFFFLLAVSGSMLAQSRLESVIPAPTQITLQAGSFTFTPTTLLLAHDFEAFKDAIAFRDMCLQWKGLPLKTAIKPIGKGPFIEVHYDSTSTIPPGGYTMVIEPEKIIITASGDGGIFYGLMTLLQGMEGDKNSGFTIACATVEDAPQFSWRGMHLDVSRHFFDVADIKSYLDYMALFKMNSFHWHLTDDQGWRAAIQQYPLLTEVGGWRNGTMVGHYNDQQWDTIRYGGYYTQKEMQEVVEYATERHINVVPEIEMPGHAMAAIAAYPSLACTEGPFEVGQSWGVYEDVFCPSETTFAFLENVLTEIMSIFPSPVIHIGGDEVPKTRWKACSHCQQLMRKEGLANEEELQSYFIQRIDKFVNQNGRVIIGWDEILEGGLAPNAMVMSWRGTNGGIAAAQAGHQVVMSPNNDCYFDHYQGPPESEPLAIGGMTTLEEVYAYEPIPTALAETQRKYILGAQGNVWTEYIPNFEQVEYMALPRMIALAEVVWTGEQRGAFTDFRERLGVQLELLDAAYVNYSRSWKMQ